MEWLTEHLVRELGVIRGAPVAFGLSVLAVGTLVFIGLRFYFEQQQQTIILLQAQLQEIQQRMAEAREQERLTPTHPRYVQTMTDQMLKTTALAYADTIYGFALSYKNQQESLIGSGIPQDEANEKLLAIDKEVDVAFREQHALNFVNLADEIKRRTHSPALDYGDLNARLLGVGEVMGASRLLQQGVALLP